MSKKIAFVTGGASGIGAATARLFKAQGYLVYLGDVQVDKGRELAEDGVRINAVCPANIATPIHTGVKDARWLDRIANIREAAVEEQAIPRMGEPEEIGEAVVWLASDAASYVSGHALVVDGGLMAGRMWRRQPPFIREFHPARV